jgi:hypothetical protein
MTPRVRNGLFAAGAILTLGVVVLGYWAERTLRASTPPLPSATVPASWHDVRESRGHSVHVGQEGIACNKCHDVAGGFHPPSLAVCAKCHEPQARMRHGLHGQMADEMGIVADCSACHVFGRQADHEPWNCIRCHEEPQGKLGAVQVHAVAPCSQCHHPHEEPAIAAAACLSCHLASDNRHAGIAGADSKNCLTCHQAHGPAEQAVERCQACHDKPHALRAGHERCTSCHEPHGFAVAEVKNCRSCHTAEVVLAEKQVPAHQQCTSCHDPHAPAQVSDGVCAKCHQSVSPAHPATEGHACTGCHDPHPKQAAGPLAQPCTSCHAFAHDDQAAHGKHAECLACHTPHAFAKPATPQVCAGCHAPQLAGTAHNAGHARCLDCHQGHPHDAALPPLACGGCHKDVHPRKEHLECVQCHEPHSGAPRALGQSCAQCHLKEQKSVAHEHADCLGCHTPHEGGKLPAAQCVSCHDKQASQNHGALAAGCTACHGIHAEQGPRATRQCTSCHEISKLPGMHTQPAHQDCKTCHEGAHDSGPFSDRKTCLTCHTKQQNHAPDAQLCQGCHVFGK